MSNMSDGSRFPALSRLAKLRIPMSSEEFVLSCEGCNNITVKGSRDTLFCIDCSQEYEIMYDWPTIGYTVYTHIKGNTVEV